MSLFYLLYIDTIVFMDIFIYMKKIILNEDIKKEIVRLYTEEFLGSPSISEKIGINKSIILRVLKENNINVGVSGRKYKGGKSESDKRYYQKNKEKRLKYFSEWQKNNFDYRKVYIKEYRDKNKDKIREVKRNYEKTRKANDPLYKLIANFRTAIYTVLKENNVNKYGHYFEILQYSPEDLVKHLEKQFEDGMTWKNYGEWHVDHILPITYFNFKEVGDDEFLKCWGLDNLQPMWGDENIKKSNKVL